jgi:phage tail-like protein
MSMKDKNNYIFLNQLGRWPGFKWSGLELHPDGILSLLTVPLFAGTLPDTLKDVPAPDGPAGLAVDCLGAVYFSDPADNRISRIDSCNGKVLPIPCLGGAGSAPAQFLAPRGLLIPRGRNALFVADSGNHRIQVFDLKTWQLIEIWGQPNAGSMPQPSSDPGRLNTPWTMAGDSPGNIYVVDYGNHRVQKFNSIGEVDSSFWGKVSAHSTLKNPTDLAVREQDGEVWIFVLEPSAMSTGSSPVPAPTIHIFHSDGTPLLDSSGKNRTIMNPEFQYGMGMTASGNELYVGDDNPVRRRILTYYVDATIEFAGDALGYDGPVAALLLNGKGGLLSHPGNSADPLLMSARAGCGAQGVLWNENPIQVTDLKLAWHRLQSVIQPLTGGAHLDLFVYTTCTLGDKPVAEPESPQPFSDPRWKPVSHSTDADITDLYIGGKEAKYLWIGGLFLSNGTATSPALSQLRVEFDHPTYDEYLPAIFRDRKNCDEFLPRLLSLFESFNMGVEDEIAALPALFDPWAAPQKFLVWLAGCLGFDLDENWDEQKQRRLIAEIFRLSGRRGTPAGLRESLRLFAGVDAVIEEPILHAEWWALPGAAGACCESCAARTDTGNLEGSENSVLGWTTMLAPAQPQGAVVGTSCDLDQSHLITNDDFGSPLLTDVAYQFSVGVYRGQIMCADASQRIRALIDQEKPAHTRYQLCVIDPDFRVGYQSRIGIDTVVAGTQRSLSLGSDQPLGTETVLAGEIGRLGMETRLGIATPRG